MKLLLLSLLMSIILTSCSRYYCTPSKRSKDYATVLKLIIMSNGMVHSVAASGQDRYYAYYECLPDSVKPGSVVWIGNYRRLSTGTGHNISVGVAVPGGRDVRPKVY